MAKKDYSEDLLIQAPTAEFLEKKLGWTSLFAQGEEDFGAGSLLGRKDDTEAVLTREVLAALERLNPGLPQAAYLDALAQVVQDDITKSLIAKNEEKYRLLRDGVPVQFRDKAGRRVDRRLRLIDFDDPTQNSYAQHVYEASEPDVFVFYRNPDLEPSLLGADGKPLPFTNAENRRRVLEWVYEGSWWVNLDSIEALTVKLMKRDPAQAERFFGNRLVRGSGSWLPLGLWESRHADLVAQSA